MSHAIAAPEPRYFKAFEARPSKARLAYLMLGERHHRSQLCDCSMQTWSCVVVLLLVESHEFVLTVVQSIYDACRHSCGI
jgi:hypothetical protein